MSPVVWAKVRKDGTEVLMAVSGGPARLGFRAVMAPGGLVQAVIHDLNGMTETLLDSPEIAHAVAAFCAETGAEPPPEDMLRWGLMPSEARLLSPEGGASVLQLDGGTVLRAEKDMDAAVIGWEGARSSADRRAAMIAMLPRLLEMLDAGIRLDARVRSTASVRLVSVADAAMPAERAVGNLDSQVVGLTPEGWVAYYDGEHGRVMTDYRTPEQWGLHRIFPAQAFENIGLSARHCEAARAVFERTSVKPSLAEVEAEISRNAEPGQDRALPM